jgi:hypothetical protein
LKLERVVLREVTSHLILWRIKNSVWNNEEFLSIKQVKLVFTAVLCHKLLYGNGNVHAANTISFTLNCYLLHVYRHSLHNASAAHPSTTLFTRGWLLTLAPLSLWLLITLAPSTSHWIATCSGTTPFTLDCYLLWHHPIHSGVATHSNTTLFTLWRLLTLAPLHITLTPSPLHWNC